MTSERLQAIQDMRNKIDRDDIIYIKQKILEIILDDKDILEILNNKELESVQALPEDYYNTNIFSYLKMPGTQSTVKNFICFDVNDIQPVYTNNIMMTKEVVFRCVSHENDVKTFYGIDRHDLLGYLVKDNFQWSNKCGFHMKKIYDGGRIAENGYYYRELHFQITNPTGLKNGVQNNNGRKQ